MKKLNQKGFSAFEITLLILVVALIAFAGYTVWQNNKTTESSNNTPSSQTPKKETPKEESKPAPDPTADWVAYSSKAGHYSLKYPRTWVTASSPELCMEGLLLLGANKDSVGKCASDGGGQMSVSSSEGDGRKQFEMTKSNYSDLVTETVVAGGVTGVKQAGTYSGPVYDGPGAQKGDKSVMYMFYANGRTYRAYYSVNPGQPDVLNDFNLLVMKTLKFSS